MVLLINKVDYTNFREVSKGRNVSTIENFIQQAQDMDLKEIMCRAFFYDLIKNNQLPEYQKLIHGCVYTDLDGVEVAYKGLKAVLVYFTESRYVQRGHIVDTPFGQVTKTNNNSEAIASAERRDISNRARLDAMLYWDECKRYLNKNVDVFTVWKDCDDCNIKRKSNSNLKTKVL